jgi:phosphatidylserine/phosphatidylglycerophosphate/cardiolipin synthase-like enzyme
VRDDRLLTPGPTCWRVVRADQFACIVDAADYFRHAKAAMLRAQHRIMLIGWDFDARMSFERGVTSLPGPNQLGAFLYWMLWKRPTLEIYVLKTNLRLLRAFDGIWYGVTPVALLNQISSKRMNFAIDGVHPTGSAHHQKIAVIDDSVAFCGGLDLTVGRWDTSAQEDDSRNRRTLGRSYPPRHEVAAAVDGAVARALRELARDRWQTATGQSLEPIDAKDSAWPGKLKPTLHNVDVGIARTLPELKRRREVREVEALNLAAIAAARHTIYLENQYLAARELVHALAARLTEDDGPEIVIVLPRSSESPLEQQAMDSARHLLIQVLWAADDHHRLGVYWPVTDRGAPVYVHSKVLVVDDRLLRVGSSNLNNRSMGFDSECDIAIEADPNDSEHDDVRRAITSVRHQLVSEHLGVSVGEFEDAMRRCGSFLKAVDALRADGRTMRPFTEQTVSDEASPLAENDLMDPDHVPRSLTRSFRRLIAGAMPTFEPRRRR